MSTWERGGKRAFDVTAAVAALVVLAPVLAVLAVLVRVRLGSPILFRQVRPGRDGRPFTLVKFRTMTDARGPDGALLEDADRLTPFGSWLRSTSLDELPELVNIIRGEMSVVGPRPLLVEYLPLYSVEQAERMLVRPGLTGWAQVNGRNVVTWEHKLAMDVWYVRHLSARLDLRIVLETVRSVALGDDVTASDHVTAPRFTGSGPHPSSVADLVDPMTGLPREPPYRHDTRPDDGGTRGR